MRTLGHISALVVIDENGDDILVESWLPDGIVVRISPEDTADGDTIGRLSVLGGGQVVVTRLSPAQQARYHTLPERQVPADDRAPGTAPSPAGTDGALAAAGRPHPPARPGPQRRGTPSRAKPTPPDGNAGKTEMEPEPATA